MHFQKFLFTIFSMIKRQSMHFEALMHFNYSLKMKNIIITIAVVRGSFKCFFSFKQNSIFNTSNIIYAIRKIDNLGLK